MPRLKLIVGLAAACAICMSGAFACSSSKAGAASGATSGGSQGSIELGDYTPLWSAYSADAAQGSDGAYIDTSSVADGYVAASCTADSRVKFQVKFADATYNYDLPTDGTPAIFPLQGGDGSYTFRIMQNTEGDKYYERFSTTADVVMSDEYQPYLRPNQIVDYSQDSACVKKAAELRGGCTTEIELISAVYSYMTENIEYDTEKAFTVESGYTPNPDNTLATGKGICFDYASLAAAMLRSQGIPCKVVTGYVEPDDIYHAWNIIYTKDQGWITMEISVESDTWKLVDTTFDAATKGASSVSASKSYTDRYVY